MPCLPAFFPRREKPENICRRPAPNRRNCTPFRVMVKNKPKTAEVCADTLDCLSGGEKVDYIKYDVEGAEYEALTGSAGTIKRYSPELSVSVYHRSEDIFKLIIKLKSINPSYRFYLRRQPCIPAWEINLYAIPAEL